MAKPPIPTDAELSILRILWKRGPSTVRQVFLEMNKARTTVLTFMQTLTEKGLVIRDESRSPHVYKARYTEEQTQKRLLNDLLHRGFEGSLYQMVMKSLSLKPVSKEELDNIHELIREHKKKRDHR